MTKGFLPVSFGLNCGFKINPFLSRQTLSSVNFAFLVLILEVQLQFFCVSIRRLLLVVVFILCLILYPAERGIYFFI